MVTESAGEKRPLLAVNVWLRLQLLQASWNYDIMQGLGLLYALLPALRVLEPEPRRRAARAHLGYFNTHPYLAAPIVGALLHLTLQEGNRDGALAARQFAEMMMAPCAAIGDSFFWAALRPLVATLSLGLAVQGSLWAPVLFLLLFAIPRLWLSITGYRAGLRLGMGTVQWLQGLHLADLAVRCKRVTAFLLGGLCALLALRYGQGRVESGWPLLAAPPLVLLLAWLLRRGVPVPLLLVLSVALYAAVGIVLQTWPLNGLP